MGALCACAVEPSASDPPATRLNKIRFSLKKPPPQQWKHCPNSYPMKGLIVVGAALRRFGTATLTCVKASLYVRVRKVRRFGTGFILPDAWDMPPCSHGKAEDGT